MILTKDEARDVIKDFLDEVATAPSEAEQSYDIDALIAKLYPEPPDVIVVPFKKSGAVANLLYQGTMKMLEAAGSLSQLDLVHRERERQLSPYLAPRELAHLKSCLVHCEWTVRWLVMNAKEQP